MVFVQLRINTVDRIAKHDGELALSFLQATEPDSSERSEDDQPNRDEIERASELRNGLTIRPDEPRLRLATGLESQFQFLIGLLAGNVVLIAIGV